MVAKYKNKIQTRIEELQKELFDPGSDQKAIRRKIRNLRTYLKEFKK